jgi:putative two-component system hydrogenase maturation factor HypX/HoxX
MKEQFFGNLRKPMRILFLTTAHNSLSQRLWIELGDRGDDIRVCVAATAEAMIDAVSRETPETH